MRSNLYTAAAALALVVFVALSLHAIGTYEPTRVAPSTPTVEHGGNLLDNARDAALRIAGHELDRAPRPPSSHRIIRTAQAGPMDLSRETAAALAYWQRTAHLAPPCAPHWSDDTLNLNKQNAIAAAYVNSCDGYYSADLAGYSFRDRCRVVVHEVGHMVGFEGHDDAGHRLPGAPWIMDYGMMFRQSLGVPECGGPPPTIHDCAPVRGKARAAHRRHRHRRGGLVVRHRQRPDVCVEVSEG